MKKWLRVILPPEQYLFAGLLSYFGIVIFLGLIEASLNMNSFTIPFKNAPASTLLTIGAAVLGAYRVLYCHPVFSTKYHDWLERTPWKWGKPLPLGPVQLVPQDAVIVATLSTLSFLHQDLHWWSIVASYLATYLVCVMASLFLTKQMVHATLMAYLLGVPVLLHNAPVLMLFCLAGLYAVAFDGLRRSLCDFRNWDLAARKNTLKFQSQEELLESHRNRLHGWPFDRLAPPADDESPGAIAASVISLLVGWWCFILTITSVFGGAEEKLPLLIGSFVTLIVFFGRSGSYLWGYVPPINLIGRIRTLRWIIPGYDIVFVAPILMIVWSSVWGGLGMSDSVPVWCAAPLQMSGVLFIAMVCPPSIRQWRLTGHHRIVPGVVFQMAEHVETQ